MGTATACTFPQYSLGERIADGCIHVLGISASLVAATALIVIAGYSMSAASIAAVAVYSSGVVAVFAFSAGYNLIGWPPLKAILRRFDHAAIYLKIAGTYTPFAVLKMGSLQGYALLAVVWAIAIFGVANKLIWPGHLVRTSYVLYLAQGWAGLIAFVQLTAAVSSVTLALLLAGGLLYSTGVVFHLWERLRYHNAIWHGFVLAASACHFAAVVSAIV
jgi:hemolysin III